MQVNPVARFDAGFSLAELDALITARGAELSAGDADRLRKLHAVVTFYNDAAQKKLDGNPAAPTVPAIFADRAALESFATAEGFPALMIADLNVLKVDVRGLDLAALQALVTSMQAIVGDSAEDYFIQLTNDVGFNIVAVKDSLNGVGAELNNLMSEVDERTKMLEYLDKLKLNGEDFVKKYLDANEALAEMSPSMNADELNDLLSENPQFSSAEIEHFKKLFALHNYITDVAIVLIDVQIRLLLVLPYSDNP